MGGKRLECEHCGHSHWQYHSCRNRHCPQCGARAKDAWLQGRLSEVLNVPYVHLVFTLPHSLNDLYGVHPRWVIDTLFACTAQTLSEFAANPKWMGAKGGTPAFSLVLHTWGQELQHHIHVHAAMACGVLDKTGQWVTPVRKPDFLFPVQALSKVFRGKFLAALARAHHKGDITHDPQGDADAWCDRQRRLYKHDWVVYAKAPLGGPAQVLEYLSRYTHRTAISNERIRSINKGEVAFTVRANDKGGKRLHTMDGTEFVRRFLLHVLPTGVKRIRHYGVLASSCKGKKLKAARLAVQMPALNPQALESAQGFMARVARIDVGLCPVCKVGALANG
ncbi:IS91 family transposase ISWz1 [Rhodoferax lithotrophicus]|uniref:IS91 family transposase ISWz1 n=1 Tax=Rhodoferax lithotrophicus TaxID=2798804 RepID=A0ABM7MGG5_9BURK|nr:IS91 family transposase [Rhodoferax sp. MIZ03]BCO25275.1 IS91 family transposase ISWz1 [Rhodoferax sp. MIZ03]